MSKDVQFIRLSEALGYLKRKHGINQQKLAEMMGTTQTTVSRNLNAASDGAINENFVIHMNEAVGNIFDTNYIVNGVGMLLSSDENKQKAEHSDDKNSATLIELAASLIKEVEGLRQQLNAEREAISKERAELHALIAKLNTSNYQIQTPSGAYLTAAEPNQ